MQMKDIEHWRINISISVSFLHTQLLFDEKRVLNCRTEKSVILAETYKGFRPILCHV